MTERPSGRGTPVRVRPHSASSGGHLYAQLRVYTVNRGKMDDWIQFFNQKYKPLAKLHGYTIEGPWVNEAKTEFIWIRSYESAEDAKERDERFHGSPEFKAIHDEARAFLAKTDVTTMHSAQVLR
jgi:hypothetical protein